MVTGVEPLPTLELCSTTRPFAGVVTEHGGAVCCTMNDLVAAPDVTVIVAEREIALGPSFAVTLHPTKFPPELDAFTSVSQFGVGTVVIAADHGQLAGMVVTGVC